jgi:pimeloyl-ACP methyl ester carboxylesterase
MAAVEVLRVPVGGGVSLACERRGPVDGPVVVLLHAWVESMGAFDRLLPALASRFHLVRFDQRGHGDSDKPLHGYRLDRLAADALAVMDALGIDAAILVGASSGGYVAQQVAVRHPDRVRALALIGSPLSLRDLPEIDELVHLEDPVDPAWVRGLNDSLLAGAAVPEPYLADRVADGVCIPADVWRASSTGLTESTPPWESGEVTVPTLLLHGGRDRIIDAAEQQAMADWIPQVRRVVLPEAGHLVLWEEPDRIASELIDFLTAIA